MSNLDWFNEARYGMFIHWGPYSVAGRGEWVANRERIPFAEYRARYAANFRAEKYDPSQWTKLARDAGMKYMVLTTRHHDGFCLWDTRTTDFRATKMGPHRDLVRLYVEACRAAGLKVGLYFSVADWFHPDYPGPQERDWPTGWRDDASRQRFIQFYYSQLEELLTNYGPIDILWYDGCIPKGTEGRAINERAKSLHPHILINERNGEPFDFRCSEQSLSAKEGAWEACMTLNDNWGYHAGDHQWKRARDVIGMLIMTASKAGNLLLNVGPKPDGTIPEQSVQILREAGQWLARNGEFLANSTRSPFSWNNCSTVTTEGNRIYIHLRYSPGREYCLTDIANKVVSATRLDSNESIPFEQTGPRLLLKNIPVPLDPIATTIRLELDGEPKTIAEQKTFWIPE